MKKILLLLGLVPMLLSSAPFHTKEQIKKISSSVVKIYTASVKPNYYTPWKKGNSKSSSGTGVIIDNNLILTAAHVVSNATFLQVKKSNDAKKYIAKYLEARQKLSKDDIKTLFTIFSYEGKLPRKGVEESEIMVDINEEYGCNVIKAMTQGYSLHDIADENFFKDFEFMKNRNKTYFYKPEKDLNKKDVNS
jgi:hypothetical protein